MELFLPAFWARRCAPCHPNGWYAALRPQWMIPVCDTAPLSKLMDSRYTRSPPLASRLFRLCPSPPMVIYSLPSPVDDMQPPLTSIFFRLACRMAVGRPSP